MIGLGLIASFIVIIDRVTKYFLFNSLAEGQSIKVIPGFFHLTLVLNTGTAFGLFRDRTDFFIILSTLVIALVCFYMRCNRNKDILLTISLGLIVGGAVGNLIDRIAFGYVIDFLDFRIWPVFNLADSAITVGAVFLAVKILLDKRCCIR